MPAVKSAPICNHDLELKPASTLAEALHAYKGSKKPLSLDNAYFLTELGRSGAAWYEPHAHRERELAALIKAQAADDARTAQLSIDTADFRRELLELLPSMEQRRQIAHSMGKRLKAVAPMTKGHQARDLTDMPEGMFLCRVEGHAGVTDDGDRRFSFAYKCGSTRFCPDCAREHSMYEAQRYATACLEHVKRGPSYRAYQLVLTRPSVPLGGMLAGVAETFTLLKRFFEATRPLLGADIEAFGYSPRKRKVRIWQPGRDDKSQFRDDVINGKRKKRYDGPGIHGMLAQLECHWTAKGAWHPHINLLVLVKGDFTFQTVKDIWIEVVGHPQANVNIREVASNIEGFARSFAELIKYPFRHVAEKNQAKRDAGDTDAPAFEEWPDAAVIEWHGSTRAARELADGTVRIQGARWLRSYGSLHGIPAPEVELKETTTVASLTFCDDGRYFVGSILGSKFPNSARETQVRDYRVPEIRPPPPRYKPPGEP